MATKTPKKTTKSTGFQFSFIKLLVGLSFAFNLAFIVFLITMFKTTYFDTALTRMTLERNFDEHSCYTGPDRTDSYDRVCMIGVGVDSNGKIQAPEWLKGQAYPGLN